MGNATAQNKCEEKIRAACPLCGEECEKYFFRDDKRDFIRCGICQLIFVPPSQFLAENEEKARYDLHQNDPKDARYREFLGRLFHPMKERLVTHSRGLDFGSGPGPALSVMFEEIGHTVSNYDTFYAKDAGVFDKKYDFITATEVLEHLRDPKKEMDRLWGCLKPGGHLGVMTKLALDPEKFSHWHYKNDPTHICFFSRETFLWLGKLWHTEPAFVDKDAVIFLKPPDKTL